MQESHGPMRLLPLAALLLLAFAAAPAAVDLEEQMDPLMQGLAPLPAAEAPRSPRAFDPPPLSGEAAAASAAGGALVLLVGFALYSRLARGQLLDHERRDGVHKLVQDEPGISLSDVAQRTGLGWGTTVYHLERLEKGGYVTSEKTGAKRCYFPVGAVSRDARIPLAALREEHLRVVAAFVCARPGATQGEMAQALGLSASAASKQVTRLETAGLVRRAREWKTVRLHPAASLAQLLAPSPT